MKEKEVNEGRLLPLGRSLDLVSRVDDMHRLLDFYNRPFSPDEVKEYFRVSLKVLKDRELMVRYKGVKPQALSPARESATFRAQSDKGVVLVLCAEGDNTVGGEYSFYNNWTDFEYRPYPATMKDFVDACCSIKERPYFTKKGGELFYWG